MKIMFCHDGTDHSNVAMIRVMNYFKPLKPDVVLLCVSEDILDASQESDAISDEYTSELSEVLRQAGEWLSGNGLEVDIMMANGEPRQMIMEAVEKKSPDLVVIARREKSLLESVFRKSISAYLVKNAGCDLLILGPVKQQD
jgi:nucleotide-binding universal stress UspA family protein